MSTKQERLEPLGRTRPNGAVPYIAIWGLTVPTEPGVYVINDVRGALYVGRSANLNRRFDQHFKSSHNPLLVRALRNPHGLLTFSWFLADVGDLPAFERQVIERLQPICNLTLTRPNTTILEDITHG